MGLYIHDNQIYNDQAHATVTGEYSGPPTATTTNLTTLLDAGLMKGTTVHQTLLRRKRRGALRLVVITRRSVSCVGKFLNFGAYLMLLLEQDILI